MSRSSNPDDLRTRRQRASNGSGGTVLRLQDIHKRYRRGARERVALDGVSLDVTSGQMVGVFGASGSGKSALLRIAAGFERPDSGEVVHGTRRLDQLPRRERLEQLRRGVGCVWGSGFWPPGLSVLEQVLLPLLMDGRHRREAQRRALEYLELCGAASCAGAGVDELSDGERQRVGIARALVIEPWLLLADAAVSNLALIEQEAIMGLLASLARERDLAVLVTDNGAGAIVGADPILYLRNGRLVGPDPRVRLGEVIALDRLRRSAVDA